MNKKFFILLGILLFVTGLTAILIALPPYDSKKKQDKLSSEKYNQWMQINIKNYQEKHYAIAESGLLKILDYEPENTFVKCLLGKIYYLNGKRNLAIAIYREILIKNPQNHLALNNLGILLVNQRSYEAGIKELQKAYNIAQLNYIASNLNYSYKLANIPDKNNYANINLAGKIPIEAIIYDEK
jgi:Tfp pilus assembly protein PilF